MPTNEFYELKSISHSRIDAFDAYTRSYWVDQRVSSEIDSSYLTLSTIRSASARTLLNLTL